MNGSYWDLPEKERAALDEDRVAEFLDYELMAAGVVRPRRPPSLEDAPVPELEHQTVHCVTIEGRYLGTRDDSLAFATPDEAADFLRLRPLRIGSEWETGGKVQYVEPLETRDAKIGQRRVATFASYQANKEGLKAAEKARSANEKATTAYAEAMRKADRATDPIWEDWRRCRAQAALVQEVLDTLAEYRRLTHGNEELALTFLAKAFSETRLDDAREWSGEPIPVHALDIPPGSQPEVEGEDQPF